MTNKNYFEDGRLDIVILGPMSGAEKHVSTTLMIGEAIKRILNEPEITALLKETGTMEKAVHIPENWDSSDITDTVFSHIDIADLVIVNITPKDGPTGAPSPNIFYEIGLLHCLGIPVILVAQSGTPIHFYFRNLKHFRIEDLTDPEAIAKDLRTPLRKFLNLNDETDFTKNAISGFYDGLPVVDISAAVGLATGYYYNYVGRLLKEGLFVSTYPDKVKRLVIVRPENVLNTYVEDKNLLKQTLEESGYALVNEQLKEPPLGDNKGPLWIDHVDGIVLDLPRTIYPLKISPKLLTMQERFDKRKTSRHLQMQNQLLLRQTSEKLLDRIESVLLYHVNKEREGYRKNLLQFARIKEVPGILKEYNVSPNL